MTAKIIDGKESARKLREKIGDDSFKTVKGVGYKFNA